MKRSVFTTVHEDGKGGFLAFNTQNGALARIDGKAACALEALGADEGRARDVDPETLRALAHAGLLAPSDADEEALFASRFLADMNQTDFLSLCIAPTMACNLRCIYCYEEHEPVRMTPDVEAAIMRFVERRHARYPFADLDVLWYGGEPMLEFSLIKRLSRKLIAWCDERGVRYRARMITNATLIDDTAAAELSRLRVAEAMPTLDGLGGTHDARRVRADGTGSFAATLAGVRALSRAGIAVGANCNMDWGNEGGYRALRDELGRERACSLYASHLRNYGGWCEGCGEGSDAPSATAAAASADAPDLMSRDAYAAELFTLYEQTNPSAESVRESLLAKRSFCRGKMASYFVIDPEGNVNRCDGFMRDPAHVLFNLLDADCPIEWPETRTLYEKNPRCRGCAVMPLCLGDCDWEWSMFDDNCSALKTTLGDYVRLLAEKLEEEAAGAPATSAGGPRESGSGALVAVLAAPRDAGALYEQPFSPYEGIM